MYNPISILLILFTLLLLVSSAAIASPTSLAPTSPNLQRRDYSAFDVLLCANSGNGGTCQLATYFQTNNLCVELLMFNHNCDVIGSNVCVTHDQLINGFAFDSQLPYAAIVHMDTNFLWGPGGPSEPWFDYGGEHVAPWWTHYDPNLNSLQFNSFGGAGVRMTFNC